MIECAMKFEGRTENGRKKLMMSFDAMVMKMTAKINAVEPGEVRVEAPPFHVWVEGVHELVCFSKRDAVERMSFGFVVCDDPECEWCHDTEETD